MMLCDVENKEEVFNIIINELRQLGIKYRLKKHNKLQIDSRVSGGLFRRPLHLLELSQATLSYGRIVEIPRFLVDACRFLEENLDTEGIFRKAGSTARQKEIRNCLDRGTHLGTTHHVIDVANLFKLFLRELPEPLLPPGMFQDCLLRCLLCKTNERRALSLVLLLLPSLTQHTLAFVMQFLRRVSQHSILNKMPASNLAIVLTPGIMPPPVEHLVGPRLSHHVRVVELLIDYADNLAQIPEGLITIDLHDSMDSLQVPTAEKKKKKRRSASLTRMLKGLRNIVGAPHVLKVSPGPAASTNPAIPYIHVPTPSSKKRKIPDNISAPFSAKKKREVLNLLPDNAVLASPFTPSLTKEPKKNRLSIGSRRPSKVDCGSSEENVFHSDRRWSVVGAPWNRKKRPVTVSIEQPIKSEPLSTSLEELASSKCSQVLSDQVTVSQSEEDLASIYKSEYEAINERVTAIESRLSKEIAQELDRDPEAVQINYERTMQESGDLDQTTDQLAKRLSRDLKIRRSAENRVIRSPSARKINTIRRRSREHSSGPNKANVFRTHSWHINNTLVPGIVSSDFQTYIRSSLRRGKPNTIHSGLPQVTMTPDNNSTPSRCGNTSLDEVNQSDGTNSYLQRTVSLQAGWQSGEVFFNESNNSKIAGSGIRKKIENKDSNHKNPLTPHHLTQTGRASVAKLRSQNVGMVLAKAKLFDGLLDADGTDLPSRSRNSPRRRNTNQSPKRSNNLPRRQKIRPIKSPLAIQVVHLDTARSNTSERNPRREVLNGYNIDIASPLYGHEKQDKENGIAPSIPDQLKQVIYDVCTPQTQKLSRRLSSPKTRSQMNNDDQNALKLSTKKKLGSKSPRRLARGHQVERKPQTPVQIKTNIK